MLLGSGGVFFGVRPVAVINKIPVIDKTILVNVNRNKYPVVRPSWALKPGLTDRLVVCRKVTLTLTPVARQRTTMPLLISPVP
jgi:hypothetical protein